MPWRTVDIPTSKLYGEMQDAAFIPFHVCLATRWDRNCVHLVQRQTPQCITRQQYLIIIPQISGVSILLSAVAPRVYYHRPNY